MKNFKNIDVSENMEVKIPKSLLTQLFGLKKRTNTPLRDFLYNLEGKGFKLIPQGKEISDKDFFTNKLHLVTVCKVERCTELFEGGV